MTLGLPNALIDYILCFLKSIKISNVKVVPNDTFRVDAEIVTCNHDLSEDK